MPSQGRGQPCSLISWRAACFKAKAVACWRWANFLESLNSAGQPELHVNLDETSVKLFVPPRPGFVAEPCPKRRRLLLQGRGGPDLSTKRAAVTLVACACDDERVQKLLPQVFVLNEHVLSNAEVADLRAKCGDAVLVTRRRSSWVNAPLMVELVKVLATCLREELKNRHIVLHMDVFAAHFHSSVLKACADAGFYVHFIPASVTSSLQPLDTAVFAKFKRWASGEIERCRLASADGQLSRAETLDVWRRGVDHVIRSQGWRRAFEHCGLVRQQHGLSASLASRVCSGSSPAVGSDFPSLSDLQAVFPTNRNIPVDFLFQTAVDKEKAAHAVRLRTKSRLPRLRALL